VADDAHRHIQLFEILLFLFRQLFATRIERFIHTCDTREANNWTRDTLVDPRERNVAHLPVVLLRKLLDTLNDLLVVVLPAGVKCIGLFFAF
jgi:hypothetical protein